MCTNKDNTNKVISDSTSPDGFREEACTKNNVEKNSLMHFVNMFFKKETRISLKLPHNLKTNTSFTQHGGVIRCSTSFPDHQGRPFQAKAFYRKLFGIEILPNYALTRLSYTT